LKINFISLTSPIHDEEHINFTLSRFMDRLDNSFELNYIKAENINKKDISNQLTVIHVKTGGTEHIFKKIYKSLVQPVYLLSTELHNSLASSLEILSWLKAKGGNGRIIHGDVDEIISEIKELYLIDSAKKKIENSRLGVIGKPSDWLIASDINIEEVKKNWGTSIVDIDIKEFFDFYDDSSKKEAEVISNDFFNLAIDMKEASNEDLIKAARVYLVLKKLISKYNLNSFTIRCFDLVEKLNTTACLALSLLNNEGVIAACEGDIPAAFTMMFIYYLSGKLSFMANPVTINKNNNIIVFAHCTVPTKLSRDYIIRSHFETGIGVGVQGKLEQGPVTVFKIGGENLEKRVVMTGELLKNLNSKNACRTQIQIRLNAGIDYFLKNPIANHHIIIPGNYANIINKYFDIIYT